jgi:hypothetical protein
MTLVPRVVVVHRATELTELVARHGTRQQAGFFLSSRSRSLDDLVTRHEAQAAAMATVSAAIPLDWRRTTVERADLARFVFGPEDVVVAVGQDGLAANVAKYLSGQPVLGINPDPARNPGVLVPHPPQAATKLLPRAMAAPTERRTMVRATADDGQTLLALNEVYAGHASHQSARYKLTTYDGTTQRQSSSGLLVGTGTGSTGWCRSAWLERHSTLALPGPSEPVLCWFVREAWPSPATGTTLTEGLLEGDEILTVTAESDVVVFGDGIESDQISLSWGQRLQIRVADEVLNLVSGPRSA